MRVAIFDRVEPSTISRLPLRLVETCSRRAAAIMLVATIPVVIGLAISSFGLLIEAASAPTVRTIVAAHPVIGLEVLAGITVWLYLLALPLKRLARRLSIRRTVEIDDGTVRIIEQGYIRTRSWVAPLASFEGVAHHVRASLSGTRHELILVHPARGKSVLLSLASQLSQVEVERVATLLGHKEIPPSSLYRFNALWPRVAAPTLGDPAHA